MSKKPLLILIILAGLANALVAQNWYKGNLHTHSLWSDGDDYPEMITAWYKMQGYNFLGLSEHNKLQEGPNWQRPTSEKAKHAFQKYQAAYGALIDTATDKNGFRVRLKTLEEYRSLFEEKDKFLLLQNEEITSNYNMDPVHIIGTNLRYMIPGQQGKSKTEVIQKTVNEIENLRKVTGWRSIMHLCHPNFGYSLTAEDIIPVQNLRFFEVFNGGPPTNNYGNEKFDSTEVIWDKVNLYNIRNGRRLLLGMGVDDTHHYHEFNGDKHNGGRAWVMVNAPSLTTDAIISAMDAGKFYVSTGVVLEKVDFNKGKLYVKVKVEPGVSYTIVFVGARNSTGKPGVLYEVSGPEAEYQLQNDDLFVRARIVSNKPKANPFRQGDMETAWVQPVTLLRASK